MLRLLSSWVGFAVDWPQDLFNVLIVCELDRGNKVEEKSRLFD